MHAKEAKSVTRKQTSAPNSKQRLLAIWRRDGRMRAVGALSYYGGVLSGKRLASILGIPPRGLRPFLTGDPLFMPEIRESDEGRGETWYRLNTNALPPPEQPPRLIRAIQTAAPRRIQAPLHVDERDNCAPVTRATRVR